MASRVCMTVAAVLIGSTLAACTSHLVAADLGVRDDASAADIDAVISALRDDPRVASALYVTPRELADQGEVDTSWVKNGVTYSEDVPNGYISFDLKPGTNDDDLKAVEDAIRGLPEYARVIDDLTPR